MAKGAAGKEMRFGQPARACGGWAPRGACFRQTTKAPLLRAYIAFRGHFQNLLEGLNGLCWDAPGSPFAGSRCGRPGARAGGMKGLLARRRKVCRCHMGGLRKLASRAARGFCTCAADSRTGPDRRTDGTLRYLCTGSQRNIIKSERKAAPRHPAHSHQPPLIKKSTN